MSIANKTFCLPLFQAFRSLCSFMSQFSERRYFRCSSPRSGLFPLWPFYGRRPTTSSNLASTQSELLLARSSSPRPPSQIGKLPPPRSHPRRRHRCREARRQCYPKSMPSSRRPPKVGAFEDNMIHCILILWSQIMPQGS